MAISFISSGVGGLNEAEVQLRTISRMQNTLVEAGVTIYFADGGSNLRIKNGKLQIRNDSTGNWHSLMVDNEGATAVPYLGDPETT